MKKRIGPLLLSLFVVMVGIQLGGGLYEKQVVVPQWSSVPPDEVGDALQRSGQESSAYRFWAFVSPPVALLALANLVAAWRAKGSPRRPWWLAASIIMVGYATVSYGYFVPTMIRLWQADTMPAGNVTTSVFWWVRLNYVRSLLGLCALVAGLRALALPGGRDAVRATSGPATVRAGRREAHAA
jgi:hypothetical protein